MWDQVQTFRRRDGLRRLAASRGATFTPWRQDLAALPFPWFLTGQKRSTRNVIEGRWDDLKVTAFDYSHDEDVGEAMVGRRRATKQRTCVLIDSGIAGRQVDVARRRPFDDLRGAGAFADVSVEDMDFALKWRLRASDERFARALVGPDLARWVATSAPDVRFSTAGRHLAVIAPLAWPDQIDHLVALARGFRDRIPQAAKAEYAPRV